MFTAALLVLAAASCKEENKVAPAKEGVADPPVSTGSKKTARPRAKTRTAAQPFTVVVTAPSPASAGVEQAATVTLKPQGAYKVNDEYPISLTVTGPPGADPKTRVLAQKDAAVFSAKEAVFKPSFKVGTPGDHRFQAVFKFSVCTEHQCELKTETLSWVAKVQ
jgi:hypothetical protein